QARTAAEAERAKTSTNVSQNEAARPLVGEALRQMVEAVSKAPTDQKLSSVQKQLTEQLKSMEQNTTSLNAKLAELTASITNADAQLKMLNAQLESVNKE